MIYLLRHDSTRCIMMVIINISIRFLILLFCIPNLAVAISANNSKVIASVIITAKRSAPSIIHTKYNLSKKNTTSKNDLPTSDKFINFNLDTTLHTQPNDVFYSVFPTFDKKEFIEENKKKIANGGKGPGLESPYMFTIFRINFF